MTRGSDLDRLPRGDLTLAHKDTTMMVCDLKCVDDRFRADIGLRDYEIMIVIRLGNYFGNGKVDVCSEHIVNRETEH